MSKAVQYKLLSSLQKHNENLESVCERHITHFKRVRILSKQSVSVHMDVMDALTQMEISINNVFPEHESVSKLQEIKTRFTNLLESYGELIASMGDDITDLVKVDEGILDDMESICEMLNDDDEQKNDTGNS